MIIDYSQVNWDWDRLAKIDQTEAEADAQPDPLEDIKQDLADDWRLAHDKGFYLKNFFPDEYPDYLAEMSSEPKDEYEYERSHDEYADNLKATDRMAYDNYLAELSNADYYISDDKDFDPEYDWLLDSTLYGWK